MRISIKIKFSIFLAVLLLLTVFILSLLALEGIRQNQRAQVEQYLARQAATANIYFIQSLMTESNKAPRTFLAAKGRSFAEQLEMMTGQPVVLYDKDGMRLSGGASGQASEGIRQTLELALNNKTAYLTDREALYYMTPLRTGNDLAGVVQFHYSLSDNLAFYNGIRQLFISIGAGVFAISFVLAYFYFNAFAGAIIRLNGAVGRIQDGHYDIAIRPRRDEIGELAQGIRLDTDLADAWVDADKDCMTIVLVNLLDNAVKYNKPGGRIAIGSKLADGQVVIEIADTGIGIPEDVAHKIFDPFFTVDRNRSRETGGRRTGLALARTYTEKQDGTLALIRTNANGTAFRLTFPAVAASPAAT